jgi:hypothetical protein
MKEREHLALQNWLQVDQDVPAADKVHLGERWIADQVVLREDAHIADTFADPVAALYFTYFTEKLEQPLG